MSYTTIAVLGLLTLVVCAASWFGYRRNVRRNAELDELEAAEGNDDLVALAQAVSDHRLAPFRGPSRDRTLHGKARIRARREANRRGR